MRRCSRSPRVNGTDPEKLLPDRSLETKTDDEFGANSNKNIKPNEVKKLRRRTVCQD